MHAMGPNIVGQSLRYLVQLRCDAVQCDEADDIHERQLAALHTTVEVFGGQIEHNWVSVREYDLILIVRLPSNQVSYTSLEMALESTKFVRAVHSAPLYGLDRPIGGRQPSGNQMLDEAHTNGWEVGVHGKHVEVSRPSPSSLEPMNWDES
jgi:uncharacterized protein with GYD domain